MEGFDAKFEPPLDKRLECPICLLAQREPMQTPCGHRFCSACILRALRWANLKITCAYVIVRLRERERERRGRYCSTCTQVKIMCLLHIHCTTRKGKECNQYTERERERERDVYICWLYCVRVKGLCNKKNKLVLQANLCALCGNSVHMYDMEG